MPRTQQLKQSRKVMGTLPSSLERGRNSLGPWRSSPFSSTIHACGAMPSVERELRNWELPRLAVDLWAPPCALSINQGGPMATSGFQNPRLFLSWILSCGCVSVWFWWILQIEREPQVISDSRPLRLLATRAWGCGRFKKTSVIFWVNTAEFDNRNRTN